MVYTNLTKLQKMFRRLVIFAVVLISLSLSTTTANARRDSSRTLEKLQNAVSYVFQYKPLDDDTYNAGKDYDLKALARRSDKTYQAIVNEFLESYESGMLPRGALFSSYYSRLATEAELIFRVLYYAPSLWDLTCVTIWMSINVNQYQLFYTMRIALLHRKDTTSIEVPPEYQTLPEYFFNSDFMKQVYDFKIGLNNRGSTGESDEPVTFIAEARYTNWYTIDTTDAEWNMTYFREDLGLNNWYCNYKYRYPGWMSTEKYNLPNSDRRGELFMYVGTFEFSRYNFERLSNDLDQVEFIEWDEPIAIGYSPSMNYPNGMQFPRRKEHSTVAVNKKPYLDLLKKINLRVNEAIDSMAVELTGATSYVDISNASGFNILGNVIEGNQDSVSRTYYGSFSTQARNILGFSPEPQNDYQILPSAVQTGGANAKDPVFYRLARRIHEFATKFKANLPPYTEEQLGCNGVRINAVSIAEGNVSTFYEYIDTEISQFRFDNNRRVAIIKARQYRLNHAPVTFKLNIVSDRHVTVIIRIFVGPKFNVWRKPFSPSEHYKYFYEADYFLKKLRPGKNAFEEILSSTSNGSLYNFPNHLIFPRGKPEGLPAQFLIHATEFEGSEESDENTNLLIRDSKPLGYPLDRPISNFKRPNTVLLDSTIYHME